MNKLTTIEQNGQRVLTTGQLAIAYGADAQQIINNYNRNKERYILGKHYYQLEGEELRVFKATNQIDLLPNVSKLYIWTEKGAWLHAKSLNTDQAWEAYDKLVDEYYRIKDSQLPQLSQLSPQLQMLNQMLQAMVNVELQSKQLEQKLQIAEHRLDNLDCTNIEGTPRQRLKAMINKFSYSQGITYQQAWHEFRANFNTAYRTNIQQRLDNYCLKNGKKITLPEYLERVGLAEDALRIADKMLNSRKVV